MKAEYFLLLHAQEGMKGSNLDCNHESFTTTFTCESYIYNFFVFFVGLLCVGHSFAYVAQFVFLRDV